MQFEDSIIPYPSSAYTSPNHIIVKVVMDSNGTTKHLLKEEITVEDRDMISSLHESILGQILSIIPTMNAVHTSVLSRRWIKVWTSITNLQFDDSLLYSGKKKMQKEQFVNFVENRKFLTFLI
ncbi:hypothetical protein P8452_52357 [Trifolium repens]|nr:hypothetical protein P8452_52357 [Trifolium repens]